MVYIIHIYMECSSSFPQGRKARRGSNDRVSCRPMQETPTRQIQKTMAADMAVYEGGVPMHRIMQCLRNLDKQTIVFVIQLIQYFVRRKYSDENLSQRRPRPAP